MPRKKLAKVENKKSTLIEFDRPRLIQVNVDLTKKESSNKITTSKDYSKAFVKPVIRFWKGDEKNANEVKQSLYKQLVQVSRHVLTPQMIPIATQSENLELQNYSVSDPIAATKLWIDSLNKDALPTTKKEALVWFKEIFNEHEIDFSKGFVQAKPFTIRQMQVQDFMPFPSAATLFKKGLTAIVGKNRSGKSAILESMLFALFGETRKVQSTDKCIHRDKDKMKSGVELLINDKRLYVERQFTRKGSSSFEIDNEKWKVKDGKERLEVLLGIDKRNFLRSCFVKQGDLHGVLSEDSTEIKKCLLEWSGAEPWEQLFDIVSKQVKEKNKGLDNLIAKRSLYLDKVEEGEPDQKRPKELQAIIEQLEKEQREFDSIQGEINLVKMKLDKIDEVKKAKEIIQGKSGIEIDICDQNEVIDITCEKIRSIREKIALLNNEIGKREKNLKGFSGRCPVDDSECPRKDEIDNNKKTQVNAINKLIIRHKKLKEQATSQNVLKSEYEIILDDWENKLKEIHKAEELIDDYEIHIGEFQGDDKELERELKRLKKKAKEPIDYSKIRDCKSEYIGLVAEEKIYQDALKMSKLLSQDIKEIEKDLKRLYFLKLLTGKTGVPKIFMQQAASQLESYANEILEMLNLSQRIEIAFGVETKKKASSCIHCGSVFGSGDSVCDKCNKKRGNEISDKLSVVVLDAGNVQTFEQDSGGGKTLLALAVRVALSRFFGVKFLVLDEVCGFLDEENLDRLVFMLYTLLKIGFEQIIIVSHRKEISELISDRRLVTRNASKGESKIEVD